MFGKLKEKLKGWFKKTEEKAELVKEEISEKKEPKKEKLKKAEKKKEEKEKQIEQERKISEEVLEDIKKEGLEIKTPEEKIQELEKSPFLERKPSGKETEEKKGFFARLKEKFKFKITEEYFDEIFPELESILLENNVAFEVVDKLKSGLKKELVGLEIEKEKVGEEIRKALKISIEVLFEKPFDVLERIKEKKKNKEPYVIVFFGINGSGKTTTIAKLANYFKEKGFSVVLAASDTFRAASIEQLSFHAEKVGVKIIKSQYNADPASVAFDAIKHAKARGINVVLIDTAGRMHTKNSLMKEMEKIVRVTKPDLKIFIGESITGNDAIEQAKVFNETIGIDGIILSKADVDDKGGTALSVSYITGKPILYLGVGQSYKDLKPFSREEFLKSLGL